MPNFDTSAPNLEARISRSVGRYLALYQMAQYVTENNEPTILEPIEKRIKRLLELEKEAHSPDVQN